MKLILIRGASAVGKSTITKALVKKIKLEYNKNCAYICEDDFRKQMQFKYKSSDLKVHLNSVMLIKNTIKTLLKLDSYDYIFIEGQFRYKEVLEQYLSFFEENDYEYTLLQFEVNLMEMKRRDIELRNMKSADIEQVKNNIESYIPKQTIRIDTSKSIEKTIADVLQQISIN